MPGSNEHTKTMVHQLLRVAGIIRHKRFHRLYSSCESRFHWAGEALFDKLRYGLVLQATMLDGGQRSNPDLDNLLVFANGCDQVADALAASIDMRVTKAMRTVRVSAGEEGDKQIIEHV